MDYEDAQWLVDKLVGQHHRTQIKQSLAMAEAVRIAMIPDSKKGGSPYTKWVEDKWASLKDSIENKQKTLPELMREEKEKKKHKKTLPELMREKFKGKK